MKKILISLFIIGISSQANAKLITCHVTSLQGNTKFPSYTPPQVGDTVDFDLNQKSFGAGGIIFRSREDGRFHSSIDPIPNALFVKPSHTTTDPYYITKWQSRSKNGNTFINVTINTSNGVGKIDYNEILQYPQYNYTRLDQAIAYLKCH